MTQIITDLGELGTPQALLTPIDLPLLRNGATWDLTNYSNPRITVWDLRTKQEVESPGAVAITSPATAGTIRWAPTAASFTSGTYEARITVANAEDTDEPSGLFRFAVGAGANPTP